MGLKQRIRRLEERMPEHAEVPLFDLPLAERQRRIDEIFKRLEEHDRWRKTATPEELEQDQRERDESWERFRLEKPELAAQLDAIRKRPAGVQ
jgi:hypothetical protein